MEAPIIIRDLDYGFGVGEAYKRVLSGVDLQVERGSLTILVGPSGSGKTTLLTVMGCLRRVQHGSVRLLGSELSGASENSLKEMRRRIGFIFQAHNLHESLTARQNVLMSLQVHGRGDQAQHHRAAEHMLGLVGLGERIDYAPSKLSGGQKQRVAVARALVAGPDVILADEPTAALDKVTGLRVVQLLKDLGRTRGTTTVMVTHDPRILELADRIVTMDEGRLVEKARGSHEPSAPTPGSVGTREGQPSEIRTAGPESAAVVGLKGGKDAAEGRRMSARSLVALTVLGATLSMGSSAAAQAPARSLPDAPMAVPVSRAPVSPAPSLDEQLGVAGGLRVDDVVRAITETSHDRRARLAEVEVARAEIDRANYSFVPRLGISVGYARLSEIEAPVLGVLAAPADQSQRGLIPAGTPLAAVPLAFPVILDQTQIRAQLAIPVTDYFLRSLPARDAAEHGTAAAVAMVEVTERSLALEAETLYWSWAHASLEVVVAEQGLAAAEAHRDDASRLVHAGTALVSDLARAEAEVAAMQELVGVAAHARDAASDRLRTLMHVDRLPPGIGETLESTETGTALEEDVVRALEHRAELRALDEQLAASEAQRPIQLAGMIPRVDVIGEALLANPNPRFVPQAERFDLTWQVGAQASWQLADALSADASQRALEARIDAARETRDVTREGIRAEIVDAHRALADAQLASSTRQAQVTSAERALNNATDLYRVGRGNSLVVVDAQTLLVRARLDLLAARIDAQIARARLHRAAGE